MSEERISFSYIDLIRENVTDDSEQIKAINLYLHVLNVLSYTSSYGSFFPFPADLETKKQAIDLARSIMRQTNCPSPRNWDELLRFPLKTVVERKGSIRSLIYVAECIEKKFLEEKNPKKIALAETHLSGCLEPVIVAYTTDPNLTTQALNKIIDELNFSPFAVQSIIVLEDSKDLSH
ncbi:MAG TPA: hypothetical protein VLE96_01120 [Chlamydiales bacterium]|nr:hypothetical protein [Chlamydiales bacterium]